MGEALGFCVPHCPNLGKGIICMTLSNLEGCCVGEGTNAVRNLTIDCFFCLFYHMLIGCCIRVLQRNETNRMYVCVLYVHIYTILTYSNFSLVFYFFNFLFRHVMHAHCKISNMKKWMSHQFLSLGMTTLKGLIPLSTDLFLCLYYCKHKEHESPSYCRLAIIGSRMGLPRSGDKGFQWCLQTSPR